MNKVFNISLHRSGTQSFNQLMVDNRIRSIHWPGAEDFAKRHSDAAATLDVDAIWKSLGGFLKKNEAFSDVPFCFLYEQAYKNFPKAKFLIILRDWQSWVASVRKHIGTRSFQSLERVQYHLLSSTRHEAIQQYSDDDLRRIYFQHIENVVTFFGKVRGQLRLFSLYDPELGSAVMDYIRERAKFPSKDYIRNYRVDGSSAQTVASGATSLIPVQT